ncbi:pheromone A receptor-domain-containing protein [Russula earlei]|uniref:Pheromone A receptor-domain-containing protein n=1 Tax=Russula earlei TaxID=71964 RepID=A0ACC0UEI6_9AGAM|nr:pheromone A receptor-domain-containing protein [Russula earlei]
MGAELPVFSFLSLSLLVLILPAQVHYDNIPSASIIAWLFVSNLIHATNSVFWFGNQAEHAATWCDISSVVLLGAMVALPGSLLCISRRLEAMTSFRDYEQRQTRTYETAFEVAMCFLAPILYMSLHTIVQDHRFVVLEDFGCQAAVHDSLPALIIVWVPPLCISMIGILFCISATINVGKSHYNSRDHFPCTPEMTSSLFIRRIIFAISGMLYLAVVYVYALSSITSSGLSPWISISQTRSQISQVEVVPLHSPTGMQSKLIWWFIPIWSLILFVLSVLSGEIQRGYRTTFTWLSQRLKKDLLPIHMKSSSKRVTAPVHLLRSGWDHDLDLRSPVGSFRSNRFSFFKKTDSTRASSPSPPPPEEEAVFAQATHTYLASSTAQQLCLPSPPPATRLPNHSTFAFIPNQSRGGTPTFPQRAMDVDPIIPGSPNSPIFSPDTWPKPPLGLPSSVSPRDTTVFTDLRPSSPLSTRSSIGSTIVDALGAIPTHLRDAPFDVNGPGVTTVPASQGARGLVQHRPSTRKGSRKNDMIYMTVVHETVSGP